MADWTDKGIQRRAINYSAFRMDGLCDLLPRMPGSSVFDIGCNRGGICDDCVFYGARVVHGCDVFKDGIFTANQRFADNRSVEARFEVVDLTGGPGAVKKAFGEHYRKEYDFMLMFAVYHKLRRIMQLNDLLYLVDHFAHHTGKFFVWRGSEEEKVEFEPVLLKRGFKLVHWSTISEARESYSDTSAKVVPQPAAIWSKP
jgi:SAM-dependent methyltransferase